MTIIMYYRLMLIISVILMLVFAGQQFKHVDLGFSVSFVLIPIVNLGYLELARSFDLHDAILANKITYLGGCYLNTFLFLGVLSLCHIEISKVARTTLLAAVSVLYAFVLSIGRKPYFYTNVEAERVNGAMVLIKDYGPVHTLFYVMMVFSLVANIVVALYSFKRRPEVSRDILWRLVIADAICFMAFFGGRAITKKVELMPLCYCMVQAVYLSIFHKLRVYDLSASVAENLVQASPLGLISFDAGRRFQACNDTAKKIIPGLEHAYVGKMFDRSDETLKKLDEWVDRFDMNGDKNVHTLNTEDGVYEIKVENLKEEGKKAGYYILISDITQEQKYIDSINSYNQQMKEAADAAISAERAKSQFFARMSHEIRTPINAVLGMNEMILRETDDEKILDHAEDIRSAGRTLLALINDLLDFSKIEEGKLELMPVTYDTVGMINNVSNAMESKAREKGLDYILEVDERLPSKLFGDDVRISQVILNLLSNAVKYTSEGYVKLVVQMMDDYEGKCEIDIRVADTGIGIREEDKARLFDSFARFDEDRNRNVEGTGLGMAIVSDLLTMMGTRLRIESIYGKGSVFAFRISQKIMDRTPIGDIRKGKDKQPRTDKVTLKAPEAKIMVVDDDKINRKVIENFLGLADIHPTLVESGFEAIEKMKTDVFDVVFLDHRMPKMDGIETLSRMRDEGLLPDETTVIALTANAGPGVREKYLDAGFEDYLSKPVELMRLINILTEYLPPKKCMTTE